MNSKWVSFSIMMISSIFLDNDYYHTRYLVAEKNHLAFKEYSLSPEIIQIKPESDQVLTSCYIVNGILYEPPGPGGSQYIIRRICNGPSGNCSPFSFSINDINGGGSCLFVNKK